MARSRKKTPIVGVIPAASEKHEKLDAHRKERRKVREVLKVEPEAEVMPHLREVSDPLLMPKDGKVYVGAQLSAKARRK